MYRLTILAYNLQLLWRNRGRILRILISAEELAIAVNTAAAQDLADIRALDYAVYDKLYGLVVAAGASPRHDLVSGQVIA